MISKRRSVVKRNTLKPQDRPIQSITSISDSTMASFRVSYR